MTEEEISDNSEDPGSFWGSVGTYLRNRLIINTIFGKAEEAQSIAGSAPAEEPELQEKPKDTELEEVPETEQARAEGSEEEQPETP